MGKLITHTEEVPKPIHRRVAVEDLGDIHRVDEIVEHHTRALQVIKIKTLPMTNYGVAIAHLTGILDKVSMP